MPSENEDRSLDKALVDFSSLLVQSSKYYMQLKQYLKYYPEEQILILTLEELSKHPHQTLQQIFKFLNVDPAFNTSKFTRVINKGTYNRRKNRLGKHLENSRATKLIKQLPPGMRNPALKAYYYPFSQKIEKPIINEKLRQKLIEYFQNDVDRLRRFTGRRFEDWRLF